MQHLSLNISYVFYLPILWLFVDQMDLTKWWRFKNPKPPQKKFCPSSQEWVCSWVKMSQTLKYSNLLRPGCQIRFYWQLNLTNHVLILVLQPVDQHVLCFTVWLALPTMISCLLTSCYWVSVCVHLAKITVVFCAIEEGSGACILFKLGFTWPLGPSLACNFRSLIIDTIFSSFSPGVSGLSAATSEWRAHLEVPAASVSSDYSEDRERRGKTAQIDSSIQVFVRCGGSDVSKYIYSLLPWVCHPPEIQKFIYTAICWQLTCWLTDAVH